MSEKSHESHESHESYESHGSHESQEPHKPYESHESRGGIKSKQQASTLHIAIDVGTTHTAVAYALYEHSVSQPRELLKSIVIVKKWPIGQLRCLEKTPTVVTYEHGRVVPWGAKVGKTHSTQISHFKFGLQDRLDDYYGSTAESSQALAQGFLTNSNRRVPELSLKLPVDFFADYLKEVLQFVNTVLESEYGSRFLASMEIRYTLTVPAIWREETKELTREAALRAGVPRRKLYMVTEPEAAALYCITVCDDVSLQVGDRFIICDAGGETVVPT
jgi:molecular chaperone DnaK (HSP70)